MSWLDSFFNAGYRTILCAGVALPARPAVNFTNATGTDNPTFNRTDVTVAGATAGGDLQGTYPNPIVKNLSGDDPAGGVLTADATDANWTPNLGADNGKSTTHSGIRYLLTEDDGEDVVLSFNVNTNCTYRIDLVATAMQKGDGGGVGTVQESWTAAAQYTRISGAATLLGNSISSPLVGGTTFSGPHFTTAGTNAFVNMNPGGSTVGNTHWTVNFTITITQGV